MSSYQPKTDPNYFPVNSVAWLFLRERLFDAIPAMIVLLVMLISLFGAIWLPRLIIYTAGLLVAYVAIRLCFVSLAYLKGIRSIRHAEMTDWYHHYEQAKTADTLQWVTVRHIVIIPNYMEPDAILTRTLEHLARSPVAQSQMVVILAMEGAEADSHQKGERLLVPYRDQFAASFVTVHPSGLPGEQQCKSANLAWVGRWINRKLVVELGWDLESIVVTTMDADTTFHPQYFTALTAHFAIDSERYQRFWQAPIQYYGDFYESHPLLRSMNAYASSMELAYLTASWHISMPISSYSASLKLLQACNFWDVDVIADEQHMFIKAFFSQIGQLNLIPIFLPFQVSAVSGKSLWQTALRRYTQTVRHAWSSKEIGYVISNIILRRSGTKHSDGSFRLLWCIAHDLVISGAGWVGVTISTQLPIWLHPDLRSEYFHRGLIYHQTILLELSGIMMVVAALIFIVNDFRARPEPTVRLTLMNRILEFVGVLLLPVYALVFVTLPVLHAQFMLLLGKSLGFRVTDKAP